ncbi:MAG: DEAD/DEAH box helicase family protein, partial [Bacteroidota bacterium]|nr:DEAD/DEAH box helicase family protein [Bacteroidota bacterium]
KRFENSKTGKSGYQPTCSNEWIHGVCEKPRIKCSDCQRQSFIPVTDKIIRNHLTGQDSESKYKADFVMGVYPLLPDDRCWFLAVDFDKAGWQKDVSAFLEVCRELNIPASIERSRSGNGGHVWIFFSEAIAASIARKLGSYILTLTMSRRPEINFDSYDRLFPSQDSLPKGGFGNLIALPLQKKSREKGNSVFLDDQFEPYKDQWSFLANIKRLTRIEVEEIVRKAEYTGMIMGVKTADEEECEEPWNRIFTRRINLSFKPGELPLHVKIILANQIYVEKKCVPASVINALIHLAAFQNPDFYKSQAMRLSTYNKPRVISCHEDYPDYIALPRGCLEEIKKLLSTLSINIQIVDNRNTGKTVDVEFSGQLMHEQEEAVKAITSHDMGILAASTAFGKTVIAINIIARRKVNTLILVHRKQLMGQWVNRLSEFLQIDPKEIGTYGGGKRKTTGKIDVALIQSISRKNEVDSIISEYGQIIIDECHHISAFSFELAIKNAPAKYILGLSATITRKDGHHPIIVMRCGPVRYSDDPKKQAEKRPFDHLILPRFTGFRMPIEKTEKELTIQELYSEITINEARNLFISEDVIRNFEKGRNSLILTERTVHVKLLKELLCKKISDVHMLTGSMGTKETKNTLRKIVETPLEKPLTLIATGKFIGEGFDEPRLDTLFLAMPISWKGTLAQYVGRLHRLHENKHEVQVYDYIDIHVIMFERMYNKRLKGYASFGYKTKGDVYNLEEPNFIFDKNNFLPVFNDDIIHGRKEIFIVSPYISNRRAEQLLHLMKIALANSAKVTVVIKPYEDYKGRGQQALAELLENLTKAGIRIIIKAGIHQNFAIIDQRIIWYGSINVLSFGNEDENIMRFESNNVANELMRGLEI